MWFDLSLAQWVVLIACGSSYKKSSATAINRRILWLYFESHSSYCPSNYKSKNASS
jgi:hypothetical protein